MLVYALLMRIKCRLTVAFAALAVVLTVAIASTSASHAEDGPDFLTLDPRGE
jgi:hypothetical protein